LKFHIFDIIDQFISFVMANSVKLQVSYDDSATNE